MTSTHITPEQTETAQRQAVEAVTRLYSDTTGEGDTERTAIARVTDAVRIYGATPAQIALGAGVRQLLVARLIDDPSERARALAAARQDAARYLDQVMEAMRVDVEASVGRGMAETELARLHGVNRLTVRRWAGKNDSA